MKVVILLIMDEYDKGRDDSKVVDSEYKKEIRINIIGTIVFLLFGIGSLLKKEVWWVPVVFFAFSLYAFIEAVKSKKKYKEYQSDEPED